VGVSHPWAFLADLVFNPCDTETLKGNISVPAFCGTVRERICDLDCRINWLGYGISQGKEIPPSIPIYSRRNIYHRQRDDNLVFYKHYRPGPCRGGIYAKRAAEQPFGRSERNTSRARRVDP
jgi:hypothetical protein